MSTIYVEIPVWCRYNNLRFAAGATEYDVQNMAAGVNLLAPEIFFKF